MGETMLGMSNNACYIPVLAVASSANINRLSSSHAEKLNNIHTDALGYNKCLFGSTLEGALMERSVNGENTAC